MTDRACSTHARVLQAVAACERGDAWLLDCEQAGRYVAWCDELIEALANCVRGLGEGPVLEVCAGDGALASALGRAKVSVIATDRAPGGSHVEAMGAAEALARHRPRIVIGCFVPFDTGIDQAVLACPTVRHYLVLNARIGGQLGDPAMWRDPSWTARPLPDVRKWMVCRHDVWIDATRPLLQHGEAWLLQRKTREDA